MSGLETKSTVFWSLQSLGRLENTRLSLAHWLTVQENSASSGQNKSMVWIRFVTTRVFQDFRRLTAMFASSGFEKMVDLLGLINASISLRRAAEMRNVLACSESAPKVKVTLPAVVKNADRTVLSYLRLSAFICGIQSFQFLLARRQDSRARNPSLPGFLQEHHHPLPSSANWQLNVRAERPAAFHRSDLANTANHRDMPQFHTLVLASRHLGFRRVIRQSQ
jgi:hypothetical protein